MRRTQVQLTERQTQHLRRLSSERGVSMSTLVRQAVDLLLESGGAEREMLWRRAMTAVGRFKSGRTDVSVRHDEHVAEGYGDPHGRLR
ncbi:MAG TPA: ribbon-helix-helix domain-containing protein [bacterium]|nr:ribbon-helix-helix domain-containing protein [bacterium]